MGRPIKTLLQDLEIEHCTAPAYALHCNPVEHINKTVKTMVAQFVGGNHRLWDQQIYAVQFAYNTARHDATGYSPAYLNHRRKLEEPTEDPSYRQLARPVQDNPRRNNQAIKASGHQRANTAAQSHQEGQENGPPSALHPRQANTNPQKGRSGDTGAAVFRYQCQEACCAPG